MTKVLVELRSAMEMVYWSDTRTAMLEALQNAHESLGRLQEDDFEDEQGRRDFRYILDIAEAYRDVRGHYSSDVKNEARDALRRLLDLYLRELAR